MWVRKFPSENLRKFIPIFPENFRKFLFLENFQKFLLKYSTNLPNNCIFVYIFTFYRLLQRLCALIMLKTLFSWLIVLIGIACVVSLRSSLFLWLSAIFTIRENFRKFPPRTKIPENLQPYIQACVIWSFILQLCDLVRHFAGSAFTVPAILSIVFQIFIFQPMSFGHVTYLILKAKRLTNLNHYCCIENCSLKM